MTASRAIRSLRVESGDVTVHAVGPGYGESVLMVVGRRLLIGADCCAALVAADESGKSYLQRVLDGLDPRPHVIWMLTHFHYDHFQGAALLLEQLGDRLKDLLVPNDYLSADLKYDIAIDAKDDQAHRAAFFVARDEYDRVRNRLAAPRLNSVVRTAIGRWSLADLRLLDDRGRALRLQVEVCGPEHHQGAKIVGRAVKEVSSGKRSREEGNLTSYVMRVNIGKLTAVFLGDAPIAAALPWLKRSPRRRAQSARRGPRSAPTNDVLLLKVAHHGSDDGTNRELLDELDSTLCRRRIAVICPFDHHDLPKPDVLRLLKRRQFELMRCQGVTPARKVVDVLRRQPNVVAVDAKPRRGASPVRVIRLRA